MGTISDSLAQVARHGYLVLFVWVTAEQLGAPVPAMPILIAAGVLSGTGQLSFPVAFLLGIAACLIGDSVWYSVGAWRGPTVLRWLCKISLEPETCVRKSSGFIVKHGSQALWFAKFIPGVSAVTVPMAAKSGISRLSFLLNDLVGATLYVGGYLVLGHVIGGRVDRLAAITGSLRSAAAGFAILGALAILGWRFHERYAFRREVRMARITPQDLRQLIEDRQNPFIVDLRHPLDMVTDARVIPGALRLRPDELAIRDDRIPRDREIILYCT